MKHVAFLIPTIDRLGGAEQQVISLALGFAQRNWKATVIALSGEGGDAVEKLRAANVHFFSLGMRKGLVDPRGWIRFHRWMSQNRPEVIHAHLAHAAFLARWSRIGAPTRAVLDSIHSPATGGVMRELSYRISKRLPDVVTVVSPTAGASWLAAKAVNERNVMCIPNGVDLDCFRPNDGIRFTLRRERGVSGEFLWLAVGRLDPVKDQSTLLHAFSKLPANARLIVAGDGPLRGSLNALSNELGLQERVSFIGFRADILPFFQAADGFVLCSRWEGLPVALLEASACEVPSVLTDIAGTRDVLPEMAPSLSAAVGDPVALATSMAKLMDLTVSERRERGRCARDFVAGKFAIDMVLDRWEALYDEVLKTNTQPRRYGRGLLSLGRTFQLQ